LIGEKNGAGTDASVLLSRVPDIHSVSLQGGGDEKIFIHRLDQLFPLASGNKIYKLLGHLQAARRANKTQLLSFGGAWSNHLHALAIFARHFNLRCTGFVRGLYVDIDNPMLKDARAAGMDVRLLSKQEYARRRDPLFLAELRSQYPNAWIIPEGGDDAYGRLGLHHLAAALTQSIPAGETLIVASGTGATVRGLAMGLREHVQLVSALVVNDQQLAQKLDLLCRLPCDNFRLFECSGAGYGRVDTKLLQQLERLYLQSGVLLDPLYNGKAWPLAKKLTRQGERVHLLHTGGVQGWRGLLSRGLLAQHRELSYAASHLEFK